MREKLSEAQRDGRACVRCETEARAMRPVGIIGGTQVFACSDCEPRIRVPLAVATFMNYENTLQ